MLSKTLDIASLSDNLTDLLSDIQNHVEVTLTQHGVPLAKVLPLPKTQAKVSIPDLNHGSMIMSDDFDDPLPDSFWGL